MKRVRGGNCRKILVTGSRGKSSIVRLIHAALQQAGLQAFARITGVVPRELGPSGVRRIFRSSGAHVEEMRWWLKQLPGSAEGIVLENSAIAPELQGLAGRWLRPDIVVLANTLPDHQEVWGPTQACATEALLAGIPRGCRVVLPSTLKGDPLLMRALKHLGCRVVLADLHDCPSEDHREQNLRLSLAVANELGLDPSSALQAMRALEPDRYDFRVTQNDGVELAMAFTANDICSTELLFSSLNWKKEETCLVFNHRSDRPGRLESFKKWIADFQWRQVMVIGDKPRMQIGSARYLDIKEEKTLLGLFRPGDQVFGCGNVEGLPLQLVSACNW